MPALLDNSDANYLIQYDDMEVEVVPKSEMNKLVFEHGLWGLLRTGDEILVISADGEKPRVRVIPDTGAHSYTLEVGEYEPVHLAPHQKADLVDALMEGKREGNDEREALIGLYDSARDVSVRRRVINYIGSQEPFASRIEPTDDGWLIHNHLLLTWDRDFYHPGTRTKTRSGSLIGDGSTEKAYRLGVNRRENPASRELTVDGTEHRLSDDELDFIARALWAISAAPGKR